MNKNSGLLCPFLNTEEDFRCSMGINKMEGYVCGGYGTCPYEEEMKEEEENIRSGKNIKKELELGDQNVDPVGDLWAAYNTARVEGYDEEAEEILKEIDRIEKEIEEE